MTERVTWALTGLVAAFAILLCSVAYLAFDQMEDDLVNSILATEASELLAGIRAGRDMVADRHDSELGALLQAWLVTSDAERQALPPALRTLSQGMHLLQPEGETWHVMVTPSARGTLYILYDATAHERRVVEFGLIVLLLALLSVVAAYALSRWLARLAVGPMVELANRLSGWAPGAPDLLVRRDDEAGRLIEAFNRVQAKVEESIAFEREFASNLSHEIRTALAAIRTDAELMLLQDGVSAAARKRLLRVQAHVDAIRASVSAAEGLAHRAVATVKEVELRQCMDEAWLAVETEAGRRGLLFQNAVPEAATSLLDPYALLMVARNLIRNAVEHAAPATLTVSMPEAGRLAFRDDGPGIPPDALPLIFQRYYTAGRRDTAAGEESAVGQRRRGLGLAIAKQICEHHGWELRVDSRQDGPDRGTVFMLSLGDAGEPDRPSDMAPHGVLPTR